MSSEIIVVIVMLIAAVGFIFWIRKNSQSESRTEETNAPASSRETTGR
jgi:hypothetical protein